MTNQDLSVKIDALYNAGEYEQIVSIVESLPKEEQDYHLLLLLAASYSNLSDLGDDDSHTYHYKAIKILKKIADQGEHDLKWLYIMGRTYFDSNFEECAIEYFEKINSIVKKDPDFNICMNVVHFIEKCKETLYERTLTIVFVTLETVSQDNNIKLESMEDNSINLYFPKYNTKVKISITEFRRSGASLHFTIYNPDNTIDNYMIEGYGHTFENGIIDALNRFMIEVNNKNNLKLPVTK